VFLEFFSRSFELKSEISQKSKTKDGRGQEVGRDDE
jgi:hypothetical protein